MSGLWSSPVTRWPRASSCSATSPVPVATSSTVPPSAGLATTIARRQRGSWPKRERRADPVVARAERREERAGVGRRSDPVPCRALYPGTVTLLADLERIADERRAHAPDGRRGQRRARGRADAGRCARTSAPSRRPTDARSWLVARRRGRRGLERRDVRDVVAIAALCEIAEESAVGGDLDELLAQLVALRLTENPEGIDEAEDAVRALQRTIGTPPHLASPARLDEIGAATRRLEQALDPAAPSPFTAALKGAQGTIDELLEEVEQRYRVPLSWPDELVTRSGAARCATLAGMEGGGFFPFGR